MTFDPHKHGSTCLKRLNRSLLECGKNLVLNTLKDYISFRVQTYYHITKCTRNYSAIKILQKKYLYGWRKNSFQDIVISISIHNFWSLHTYSFFLQKKKKSFNLKRKLIKSVVVNKKNRGGGQNRNTTIRAFSASSGSVLSWLTHSHFDSLSIHFYFLKILTPTTTSPHKVSTFNPFSDPLLFLHLIYE